ncbi:MAG: hypothetical protein LN415_05890 [Candidatus Thermoplasmatota archaeon]|nr:hypothetical protein [Candidatus Thermoplasmatota archaeon]
MRRTVAFLVVLGLLSSFAFPPWHTASADGPDAGIVVDLHEIDMVQMTNNTAFLVVERAYFNNTGESEFNDTLHSWLPVRSRVISMACGDNSSTTVMRRVDMTGYKCYDFSRDVTDENVIAFTAFEENETLSYFGQNATLVLNASNGNGTSWHSVPVNITVGWGNESRFSTPSGQGLRINASDERMDAVQLSASQTVISASHLINVTSQSLWNETVSFSVDGLPLGWEAHVRNDTAEIDTVDLEPNETRTLTFVVELPPHKMLMEFLYILYLEPSGDVKKSATYEQSFLYNVTDYSLWLFSRDGSTVSSPANYSHIHHPLWTLPDWLHSIYIFDPDWSESEADFHEIIASPSAGDSLQVVIEWEKEVGEGFPLWILAAIVVLIVSAIVLVFMWKRSREPEEKEETEEPSERPEAVKGRREEIAESLREAEATFAAGHISKPFYEDLKSKYEGELDEVEGQQEDPEIVALKGEKEKLLRAIKGLQRKRDEGEISESAFQRLVEDYKKRAIDIMKQIDQRRG